MPPRLSLAAATRALTIRTRPSIIAHAPLNLHTCRAFARTSISRTGTSTTNGNGNANANANKDELLLGVSEEAAKESEILGEVVPDLGMGTKVQDVRRPFIAGNAIRSSRTDDGVQMGWNDNANVFFLISRS
jgi:hypothetical protein